MIGDKTKVIRPLKHEAKYRVFRQDYRDTLQEIKRMFPSLK
jgi:hypothetical protein